MNEPTGYTALDLVGFSDKGNYSNSTSYVQNDLVHYSGNLWKCKVDDTINITPAENANWTLWIGEPTNLMEAIIAPIEHSPATAGHSVGDQLIWNDVLYKVIATIQTGDSLTVNTNIVAARKIVYQISGLESDIATIEPVATASQNYSVGDFLFYDWDLYKVTAAITSGDPIVTSGGSANVEAVTVGDELKALKNHVTQTDSNLAYVEEGNTATRNYSKGDYCVVGGILRKVIATNGILSGVGFTEGSNISAGEHLADEVSALNQSISNMFITDVYDCPAFTVTGSKSLGEYITEVNVNVAKTGYTPVAVTARSIQHPAAYHANVALNGAYTVVFFDIYKAINSSNDQSIAAGDMKAYVLYKKN